MRPKPRHYRAVERQKAEEELNDLYPISLDYSAFLICCFLFLFADHCLP